jgi:hypothetical protein
MMELYLRSPIHLHGMVLNILGAGTTLLIIIIIIIIIIMPPSCYFLPGPSIVLSTMVSNSPTFSPYLSHNAIEQVKLKY